MSHQKKENRNRKRKQPIPPVSIHPTKKQLKEREERRRDWSGEIPT